MLNKKYGYLKNSELCPLCLNSDAHILYISKRKNLERNYYKCNLCFLVFVPDYFHISPDKQKLRYLEHENDINSEGYKSFLFPVLECILPNISLGDKGLDYGSGPGPALAHMLISEGMMMDTYDIYFNNDLSIFNKQYDFITCTETIEHFVNPNSDFDKMISLLKPKGHIAIMTSILYEDIDFENWYYRLDPTHVSFYTPHTMDWIANKWALNITSPRNNIYILNKRHIKL